MDFQTPHAWTERCGHYEPRSITARIGYMLKGDCRDSATGKVAQPLTVMESAPRGDVRAMHPRIVVDWLIGRRSGASARYGSFAGRPEQDGVIADGTTPARSCSPDKAIGAKIGTES